MALGSPGPLGFPFRILEENPSCVGCCGSQQEKRCCWRGIPVPHLNWKLNKPQAGLKVAGELGTSEIRINCGHPQGVNSPQGLNFAAPTGASFLPFLLTLLEMATFGIPGYCNNCSTAFMGKGLPRSAGRGLKGRAGNGRDELEELISSQAVQTRHS